MNSDVISKRQLMFNDDMSEIIEEPINYWKNVDEVPEYIRSFILSTSNSRVIYDPTTKEYYCSKCLKMLDKDYYCSNCSRKYKHLSNKSKYVINTSVKEIRHFNEKSNYYVFDIVDGCILLYVFSVSIHYNCHTLLVPYQICSIEIENVYHVTKTGIIELINDRFTSFAEYDKYVIGDCDDFDMNLYEIFEVPDVYNNFLYVDNLKSLQNTSLYKYTSIWELNEYFKNNNFTLASLSYYPVHFKQFEYLVKMKLYHLACNSPYMIRNSSNFKDAFGVDKKYYSFMRDINIDVVKLEALRIFPTVDIEVINFISKDPYLFKELSCYVKPDKLKIYFEKQGLEQYNIYEYYDYIKYALNMGLDLKDKRVLFPEHFTFEHDRLATEMVIASDPEIDKKIHLLSDVLALNIYKDDNFIIFPADSVSSLIDESTQMSNCVRNYSSMISSYDCQIYFMRYKNSTNRSLVTVEVRDGKVVQARTRFNGDLTDEMKKFLTKWEEYITPVEKRAI